VLGKEDGGIKKTGRITF